MNKSFFIVFFLFCNIFSNCQQNLIYNGDFEIYDTCPDNGSSPSDYEIEHCIGWNAPTYATSDYFNSCNTSINGLVGVPNNVFGFQSAYSGVGYCGFYAFSYSAGGCNYNGSYWWEYIQGQFISELEADHIYKISFYFSLANASELAIDEIGFYISKDPVYSCNSKPLDLIPQIKSPANVFLTDTSKWFIIESYYLAEGGEKHITIGNFSDSVATDTLRVLPVSPSIPFSYYYVDAGESIDYTEEFNFPNVFSPNGDGINDLFSTGEIDGLTIDIYNRWGVLVAVIDQDNLFWEGRNFNSKDCPEGVYYYIATKGSFLKKGFIQLVR